MKQGVKNLMPIEIGINLDMVERIRFKFVQRLKSRIVDYPSDEATRLPGTDTINVVWTPEQTFEYNADFEMLLDTQIELTDSEYSPSTEIVKFKMRETLFTPNEVIR